MNISQEPLDELHRMCLEARRILNENFAVARRRAAEWEPSAGPVYLDACLVGDLRPGDIWMQGGDEVRIAAAPEHYTDPALGPMVRIYGRIIRGWGAQKRVVRTWTWRPTQTLQVRR